MTDQRVSKTEFEKPGDTGVVRCMVEVCSDGSVYIEGDEIEMIFEFAPNNLDNATRHVESLGYVRRCED